MPLNFPARFMQMYMTIPNGRSPFGVKPIKYPLGGFISGSLNRLQPSTASAPAGHSIIPGYYLADFYGMPDTDAGTVLDQFSITGSFSPSGSHVTDGSAVGP